MQVTRHEFKTKKMFIIAQISVSIKNAGISSFNTPIEYNKTEQQKLILVNNSDCFASDIIFPHDLCF
jgi:short-subunit dehydrogenase